METINQQLAHALERIKELEANEQILNDAHCKLMDKVEEKDKRIKELRYNIAMAKAYGWKYTYTNCDTYGFWMRNKKKDYKTYRQQWLRIAEALEAKANKIKEAK